MPVIGALGGAAVTTRSSSISDVARGHFTVRRLKESWQGAGAEEYERSPQGTLEVAAQRRMTSMSGRLLSRTT
jgi:hypothetical protein